MTNRVTTKVLSALTVLCATLGLNAAAHAVPTIQVDVVGGVWDPSTETHVLTTSESGGTVVITVTNENGKTTDPPVHMVVSALQDTHFEAALGQSSTFTESQAGTSSVLGPGGDATNAVSYLDFDLGNYTGISKGGSTTQTYVLTLKDLTGTVIIDAYGKNDSGAIVFAPYSHNAAITLTSVPELSAHGTGAAAVLLTGVALVFGTRRRRTRA
jgi:hypothetical protein